MSDYTPGPMEDNSVMHGLAAIQKDLELTEARQQLEATQSDLRRKAAEVEQLQQDMTTLRTNYEDCWAERLMAEGQRDEAIMLAEQLQQHYDNLKADTNDIIYERGVEIGQLQAQVRELTDKYRAAEISAEGVAKLYRGEMHCLYCGTPPDAEFAWVCGGCAEKVKRAEKAEVKVRELTADNERLANNLAYARNQEGKNNDTWSDLLAESEAQLAAVSADLREAMGLLEEATEVIIWMSGSDDFAPGNKAGGGWYEFGRPRLEKALGFLKKHGMGVEAALRKGEGIGE